MGNGICALLPDLRNDAPGRSRQAGERGNESPSSACSRWWSAPWSRSAARRRRRPCRRPATTWRLGTTAGRGRTTTTFTYNDPATANVNLNERRDLHGRRLQRDVRRPAAYRLNISGTVTGGGGSARAGLRQRQPGHLRRQRDRHPLRPALRPGPAAGAADPAPDATANILSRRRRHGRRQPDAHPRAQLAERRLPAEPGRLWNNSSSDHLHRWLQPTTPASVAPGRRRSTDVFDFDGPANVAAETIPVPIGSVRHRQDHCRRPTTAPSTATGGRRRTRTTPRHYHALPLDAATADHRPAARAPPRRPHRPRALTATVTPSLDLRGRSTVHGDRQARQRGRRPGHGGPDKSPVNPGQQVTVDTTTVAGGNYSATLNASQPRTTA